jgi:hypothetical protein
MSSGSPTRTRYRTGQVNVKSGVYRFDGYTDGTSTPAPRPEEREIPLALAETFPPIRSCNKGCYWILVRDA